MSGSCFFTAGKDADGEGVREYDLGLPFVLQVTAGQVPSGAGIMRSDSAMDMVVDLMMEKLTIGGCEVDVSIVGGCRTRVQS